jgi:hypothetical protein
MFGCLSLAACLSRVRFIFLQAFPLCAEQREAAAKDDWQQDGEDLQSLLAEPKSDGSREEERVQAEGVE